MNQRKTNTFNRKLSIGRTLQINEQHKVLRVIEKIELYKNSHLQKYSAIIRSHFASRQYE